MAKPAGAGALDMAFNQEPTMKLGVGEPAMGYPASAPPAPNPYLQPLQPLWLQAVPNTGKWTTGLCGCCSDCSSCCAACCCPCVLVGRVANIVDRGATSAFTGGAIFCLVTYLTGLGCLYSCLNRSKVRNKYGLPEEPCSDLCTECCCTCCSIAQTYRELKNRGVDPALGYEMVQHIYDQPPVNQNMQRSW